MKKWVIITILAILAAVGAVSFINKRYPKVNIDVNSNNGRTPIAEQNNNGTKGTPATATSTPTSYPLPTTLLLKVPFTPQAPTANWSDPLYQEGCEEASALMASEYFKGNAQTNLDKQYALEEIKKATDWELENFGYNLDITTEETAKLVREYYGLNAEIAEDYTEQNIKKFLSEGKLVLMPANGQKLGNPNFRQPGPPYHMLVIKGYNSTGFITNDPGTRNGLNYSYTFQRLYDANGDFSHNDDKVDLSKKLVLVVWK